VTRPIGILACWLLLLPAHGDDWPQWLGPRRDAVWRETGILKRFPPDGPKVLWRAPIGPGYTGPAVARGRVVTMDRRLAPGSSNPSNPFQRGSIPGTESVLCHDADSGRLIWRHEYPRAYTISYPKGPRATPAIDGERVYTLGAEGDLHCLRLSDGTVVWRRHFSGDYGAATPTWGFAAHPLVVGDHVITLVGGEGSAVVAFDKRTGRECWRALTTDDVAYCPPVICRVGDHRLLVVWLIDGVHGLDPANGKVLWSHEWKVRGGGSIAMPRQLGDRLFLSTFFNGSLMLRLQPDASGVVKLWQSPKISAKDTTQLHALNAVPWLEGEHIYGVCNHGQFRCLEITDGARVWESLRPLRLERPRRNATAFLIKHE
jgi:outer membrane protein assembly factor BamB